MFSPFCMVPPHHHHFLCYAKTFNFDWDNWFVFAFISFALRHWSKKILLQLCQRILHLYSWRLLVSCLIFRFLSHFEFLCMVWENVLISLIYESSPDFSTPHVEEALFSILYSCFLCHRLFDHISLDLFLVSLFYFTNLYICCAGILLFCIL